ncbi:MAG: DUF2782 domain-containing protein [Candidatus Thiodiazotropha sp.]
MSHLMKGYALLFAGLLLSRVLSAADAPEPPELPLPEMKIDDEVIEPDVTIIKKDEGTISEYRINGQLYMVKIQPNKGPAYYLIDRDGDGEFDSRSDDPTNITVPQWILLRW